MKNLRQQKKKIRENCTDFKKWNNSCREKKSAKYSQTLTKISFKYENTAKRIIFFSLWLNERSNFKKKKKKKKKTILQSIQKKDVMNELKVTNVPYFFALWRLSEAQILDGTKNLKKRKK